MPALRITVAISLFNKAAHIGAALDSVLRQSVSDFDIIVVDDGSTDEGPDIVQRLCDPRITLHRQANGGVSAARNVALKLAQGEFVAFLDADDLWRPRHLEHLIALKDRFPDAVLYGNAFVATKNAETTVIDKTTAYEKLDDYFSRWVNGPTPFHTSSTMARRTTALAVGGFPERFSRGEDLTFFVRMALAGAVAVSNYIGCLYLQRASGLTSKPVLEPDICTTTIRGLLAEPDRISGEARDSLLEFADKIAIANALDCVKAGYKAEALRFLEASARTHTQRRRWWQARILASCPGPIRALAFSMRDLGRWA
jgi:cellulose synthase/poly-beta-1,6-N-acetylglucosamine synthase-like glycosyltransferase